MDVERYQALLEHTLSKVYFSVGTGIYILPSNLNLSIGKTKGHNNKILVRNKDIKIGLNKGMNKDHKKLLLTLPKDDAPKIVNKTIKNYPAVQHGNPKMQPKSIMMKN